MFSRREFLMPWTRRPSSTIDTVVEYGGEVAMVGALGALALHHGSDKLKSYTPQSERISGDNKELKPGEEQLVSFRNQVHRSAEVLSTLKAEWRKQYRHTYSIPVSETHCDSNGKNCTTTTRWEEHEYWTEPEALTTLGINRNSIANMQQFYAQLSQQSGDIIDQWPYSLDFSNAGGLVYFRERVVDTSTRDWIGVGLYGLAGTLFATYEEIAKAHQSDSEHGNREDHASFADRFIKRRTFLKGLTAFASVPVVQQLQRWFSDDNRELLHRLEQKKAEVVSQLQSGADNIFGLLFNRATPATLREQAVGHRGLFEKAESIKIPEDQIAQAMKASMVELSAVTDQWETYFPTGSCSLPMATIIGNVWGTRELSSLATSESVKLNIEHVVVATILAAGFLGMAATNEKLLLPASQKILELATKD